MFITAPQFATLSAYTEAGRKFITLSVHPYTGVVTASNPQRENLLVNPDGSVAYDARTHGAIA